MIAVAGNPRSGTSLMMRCFVEAVGKDRILGEEFPQMTRMDAEKKQGEKESDQHYKTRMYTMDKYPENSPEAIAKFKDMNPNGFWEMAFTVRGIKYSPGLKETFEKMDNEDKENPLIVKLVNSGLFASDCKYVDKVVYMVRHPRNVAKSQEKLKREQKFTLKDGRVVDLYEGQKVHSPQFYIQSTSQFARWKLDNPDIPVLFIQYDDLVAEPKKTLEKISDFTKVETLVDSYTMINPKLNRSKPEEIENNMWEESEMIHGCLLDEDFQGIIDIASNPNTNYAKSSLTFTCLRLRAGVAYNNCISCRRDMNKEFIISGLERAEANSWEWWNEPCVFECGFDPDDENPLTIEESIVNNHWDDIYKYDFYDKEAIEE